MNKTFAAIKQVGPKTLQIVFLFKGHAGPVHLNSYSTKEEAMKAINKITEKDRKIVSYKRLYEEHAKRIHQKFMEMRSSDKKLSGS